VQKQIQTQNIQFFSTFLLFPPINLLAIILVVLFLSTKLRTDPRAIKNKFLLLGLTISSLWAFLLLNHPSGYDQIQ
jgi:hypothetical protein